MQIKSPTSSQQQFTHTELLSFLPAHTATYQTHLSLLLMTPHLCDPASGTSSYLPRGWVIIYVSLEVCVCVCVHNCFARVWLQDWAPLQEWASWLPRLQAWPQQVIVHYPPENEMSSAKAMCGSPGRDSCKRIYLLFNISLQERSSSERTQPWRTPALRCLWEKKTETADVLLLLIRG